MSYHYDTAMLYSTKPEAVAKVLSGKERSIKPQWQLFPRHVPDWPGVPCTYMD